MKLKLAIHTAAISAGLLSLIGVHQSTSAADVCCFTTSSVIEPHPEGPLNDSFGKLIQLDGKTLAVSASGHDFVGIEDAGAIFMYDYVNNSGTWSWSFRQKLDITGLVSSADAEDASLYVCEIDGDTLAFSGVVDGTDLLGGTRADVGAVFVYKRDSNGDWQFDQRVDMPSIDVVANARFGNDLALSGNRLLVGAPNAANKAGAVYVFERTNSTQPFTYTTTISSSYPNSRLGGAVDLDGNYAVLGASYQIPGATPGSAAGRAFLYRKTQSGWALESQVNGQTGQPDGFGRDVEIQTNQSGVTRAVVAAFEESPNAGVYVYRRSGGTWTLEDRLERCDVSSSETYGRRVQLDEDTILVNTRRDGAFAHRYENSAWVELGQLGGVNTDPNEAGFHSTIDGDLVVLSDVDYLDANNNVLGAFFTFDGVVSALSACPCLCTCAADLDCDCMVGMSDQTLLLAAWGTCGDCPEDLNGDGVVDFDDLVILLGEWGTCD